jgi:phytoene dehydrogenase-like protein
MEGTLSMPGMGAGHRWRDGHRPAPNSYEDVDVVVVGGGISGLVAARELVRRPGLKVRLLELASDVGGNASGGLMGGTGHPWGAHYVPVPGAEAMDLVGLFRELGVVTGVDSTGRPEYREEYLCHDPEERLFLHGRWQEGLVPQLGVSKAERDEIAAFLGRMEGFRRARGSDGRRAFAIPVDASSADAGLRALDRETFASWLDREGFRGAPIRWYVDYCCRDDFGMGASKVSAWAGIHYFASRDGCAANAPPHAVLTWPEGNAWLARRLREPIEGLGGIRRGVMATRVEDEGDGVRVEAWDVAGGVAMGWRARHAVLAVPSFVAARLLGGQADDAWPAQVHAPWLVANLWLDHAPTGRGAPLSWDNVIFEGRGLGYVVANHQSLQRMHDGLVLTYYLPMDHADPATARREAATWSWNDVRALVMEDMERAHPGMAAVTRRLDARVWGHGMVTPVPGTLWGGGRRTAARIGERIWLAHTDHAGISIFEEAHAQGLRAARAIHAEIPGA